MKCNFDITDKVAFGNNDDEFLPLLQCACGREFDPWSFVISIYPDNPTECPECKRKLWFSIEIKVYGVVGDK